MQQYEILMSIHPLALFGLPDEGKTVIPAQRQDVFSAPMDSLTGNPVGHPTLSKYRENPLHISKMTAGIETLWNDNFLLLRLQAENDNLAINRGIEFTNRFCVLLSVYQGHHMHAEAVQAVNVTTQTQLQLPRFVHLLRVTAYDLDELASNVLKTTKGYAAIDQILDKAMAYFYHGLYLWQEGDRLDPFSFHRKLVTADTC